ncbi:MAG TPA: hypothetical protein VNA89_16375 [Gemmatimonadaceae bacterium]|nr:hypothetical protein [Gemmatimonadaceae bacterium]
MPLRLLVSALALTLLVAGVGYLSGPSRADRSELLAGDEASPTAALGDDGKLRVVLVLAGADSGDVRTTFDARLVRPDGFSVTGTARGALGRRPPSEMQFVVERPFSPTYLLVITARREAAYRAYGYVHERPSGERRTGYEDGRLVLGATDCVYVRAPANRYSYMMLQRYWAGPCEPRLTAWLAGDTTNTFTPPASPDPWQRPRTAGTTPVFRNQ